MAKSKTRKGLGDDPFAVVAPKKTARKRQPPKPKKRERADLVAYSIKIDELTLDRLRNATYWSPGVTLSGLIREAVNERIDRMERKRGGGFPAQVGRDQYWPTDRELGQATFAFPLCRIMEV